MGENAPWVENLGNAFLAQPQDVMDSVQRLRAIAQQTGTLKSTPQQKVITATRSAAPAPAPATSTATASRSSSAVTSFAPAQVIKIESTNPNVVYVPAYNPSVVYGAWPDTAYPPVYLPPPPGEQFTDSFVKGFGYSLGVATTYALFSSIDWDDDDHHHHDDDDHHHDDDHHGGYAHNGDNININVNNFNHITGQNLPGNHASWQHNPAYRGNIPYPEQYDCASITIRPMFPAGLARPNISPPIATRSVRRP
ncbi:membrane protein [Klebsiella michiganensis]|uniref:Membrane protein n=1 Tax=Klebsiella michiganensis TaxID=1134687 RepID=A0A7H4N7H6_9ENTR|nr:membrane protein [Klebsiella michiganensis]